MNRVKELPDCYAKSEGSNNHKLLEIHGYDKTILAGEIEEIRKNQNMDDAKGYALDLIGGRYGQNRGFLTDDQYRIMVKAAIAKSVITGTYSDVKNAVILMLGCDPGEILLGDADIPRAVRLMKFPFQTLLRLGFSSMQVTNIISTLLPTGVRLLADNFEGTFEFAETDSVYDEDRGFADLEQTVGGFLGLLLGDDYTQEGTFEFSAMSGEFDTEKGFADLDQTIGGYLGLYEAIPILPV